MPMPMQAPPLSAPMVGGARPLPLPAGMQRPAMPPTGGPQGVAMQPQVMTQQPGQPMQPPGQGGMPPGMDQLLRAMLMGGMGPPPRPM